MQKERQIEHKNSLENTISVLHKLAVKFFDSGRLEKARQCMELANRYQSISCSERVAEMEKERGLTHL